MQQTLDPGVHAPRERAELVAALARAAGGGSAAAVAGSPADLAARLGAERRAAAEAVAMEREARAAAETRAAAAEGRAAVLAQACLTFRLHAYRSA